jgi:uncharacterized protein YdhG (YjbR/CyaY superfamily)
MAEKRTSVDAYLASLPDERRARLEDLRRTILAAAPDVQEGIAYNMPAYRVGKRFMVSFEAYKRWDSLFPASEAVENELGDDVAPYVKGRGTLQFPITEPLPLDLIDRIIRIRHRETVAAGTPD